MRQKTGVGNFWPTGHVRPVRCGLTLVHNREDMDAFSQLPMTLSVVWFMKDVINIQIALGTPALTKQAKEVEGEEVLSVPDLGSLSN